MLTDKSPAVSAPVALIEMQGHVCLTDAFIEFLSQAIQGLRPKVQALKPRLETSASVSSPTHLPRLSAGRHIAAVSGAKGEQGKSLKNTAASDCSPDGPGKLWNYREAAEFLRISAAQLGHMTREGQVPCVRFGRCVRFVPGVLAEHVRQMAVNELRRKRAD
jgi:hypothetical protein